MSEYEFRAFFHALKLGFLAEPTRAWTGQEVHDEMVRLEIEAEREVAPTGSCGRQED